jgi:hypothetical protein
MAGAHKRSPRSALAGVSAYQSSLFQSLVQAFAVGHPAEHTTLHFDHLDRGVVIAHVSSACAVFEQEAPIAEIIGLPHDRMNANIGCDPT